MSLKIWLPLNGHIKNQGLSTADLISGNVVYKENGVDLNTEFTINCANLSNAKQFSVSFWVKPESRDSTSNWCKILRVGDKTSSGSGGSNIRFETSYGSQASNVVSVHNNSAYAIWEGLDGLVSSTRDVWHHVCLICSDKDITVYCDGQQVMQSTTLKGGYLTGAFTIGQTNYTSGVLRDLRIWDNAISLKEMKELSKGLVLHYKLSGIGGENFILESRKVTSGGNANGITRSYESDGSMKIIAASSNGNYASLGFAQNSNDNVGAKLLVGDIYTISCDVKVESGTKLPSLFINSGNSYKQLQGDIKLGEWIRASYTSTWAEPGTNYGNISLHLGFSNAIGTYYFKNFKLEKGDRVTPWIPSPFDAEYTSLGFNDGIEHDCSGFGNNGEQWAYDSYGSITFDSNTPRYTTCIHINNDAKNASSNNASGTRYIYGKCALTTPKELTISFWCKPVAGSQGSTYNGQFSTTNNSIGSSAGNDYLTSCFNHRDAGIDVNSSDGSTHLRLPVAFTANEWHYYTFTYDGQTANAYVDGVLKNTVSFTSPTTLCSMVAIVIGFSKAGGVWRSNNSYYSDFRIYSTALSADDILTLYNTAATIDNQGNLFTYEVVEG